MRITIPATLLVALLVAGPAVGQQIQFASYGDIQTAYEAQSQEITHLRARLAALESTVEQENGNGCQTCNNCCCSPCCCDPRSAGLVAGAEMLFLKPHSAGGMMGITAAPVEFGYEIAPRVWLGFADATGLGARIRWTDFDHTEAAPSLVPGSTDSVTFDLSVLDFEATLATELGYNWDATVFGGLRCVDYNETLERRTGAVLNADATISSGTIGLTAGGEVRRPVYRNLSVFGGLRASVMMGDEGFRSATLPVLNFVAMDTIKYIYEAQLGAELTQPLPSGGVFFLRGAFEGQVWDGYNINAYLPALPQFDAVGFGGFTIGAGIMR
jgi:hypothetical protein